MRIMWSYTFLYICGCALRAVVAMPDHYTDKPLSNEVVSYNFPFISRSDWHARDPVQITPLNTPVPYVVIHHTYTPPACFNREECSAAMRQMQHMHIDGNEWWDIGYHFCVGSDGVAYEGRGWETLGAQALHFNSVSIGICLIGDWRFEVPSAQQLKTAKDLIATGVQQGYIQREYKLVGHRQVRATECPGGALFEEIQSWDHYSPFPRSHKDLLNVTEIPESVKQEIRAKNVIH